MTRTFLLGLTALLSSSILVHAKTDIAGCTSTRTVNQWNEAILLWYVPETGEICETLDCGGGRAPPKYSVPGCGHYTGTDTYKPRYITFSDKKTATPPAVSTTSASGSASASTNAAPTDSASSKPGASGSSASASQTGMTTVVTSQSSSAPTVTRAPSATGNASTGLGGSPTRSSTVISPPIQTVNAASGRKVGAEMLAGVVAIAGLVML